MAPTRRKVLNFWLLLCILTTLRITSANGQQLKPIFAINAGGEMHQDIHGVIYSKDPSTAGVASDYGMRWNIDRSAYEDEVLYQTERYSSSTFGYEIPIKDDGAYVLVLKFAEVYFRAPGQKVFHVGLNSKHKILENVDIFAAAGYNTAYDEVIPFFVSDNGKTLLVGSESSPIRKGKISLDFVKGPADNPKINAFYVAKGHIEDVPHQPALGHRIGGGSENEEDNYLFSEDDEDIQFSPSDLGYDAPTRRLPQISPRGKNGRIDIRSGPPAQDPWDLETSIAVWMPVIGAVATATISGLFLRLI